MMRSSRAARLRMASRKRGSNSLHFLGDGPLHLVEEWACVFVPHRRVGKDGD
jgi:hypothetical protein